MTKINDGSFLKTIRIKRDMPCKSHNSFCKKRVQIPKNLRKQMKQLHQEGKKPSEIKLINFFVRDKKNYLNG